MLARELAQNRAECEDSKRALFVVLRIVPVYADRNDLARIRFDKHPRWVLCIPPETTSLLPPINNRLLGPTRSTLKSSRPFPAQVVHVFVRQHHPLCVRRSAGTLRVEARQRHRIQRQKLFRQRFDNSASEITSTIAVCAAATKLSKKRHFLRVQAIEDASVSIKLNVSERRLAERDLACKLLFSSNSDAGIISDWHVKIHHPTDQNQMRPDTVSKQMPIWNKRTKTELIMIASLLHQAIRKVRIRSFPLGRRTRQHSV